MTFFETRRAKKEYNKQYLENYNDFNQANLEERSEEVKRLIGVVPSPRQKQFQKDGFMVFMHFGMNTFTNREWGTGKEQEKLFNPPQVDTDQWCEAVKASGAKGIILTCKHHDGFCLFQTEYTEHSIKNSPYKNGKGDILAELATSCKKYGLKVGVYLSPWDMNSKVYGTKAYDDYFVNQLTELLTNYGEIYEVWFDGAKGANVPDFNYDWQRYYDVIRALQPNAVISVCGPDVRWCGNEAGKCRESEWNVVSSFLMDAEKIQADSQSDEKDLKKLQGTNAMEEDLGSREVLKGAKKLVWYPAEVDVSIRKGWFYHRKEDRKIKSLQTLLDIYCSSVGGNATLLLNVPPNKQGRLASGDVLRLAELGKAIQALYANPILEMDNIDMDYNIIDAVFSSRQNIKTIVLEEDLDYSQRVEMFDVYLGFDRYYKRVYHGTTIGSKKIIRLPEYASAEKCYGVKVVVKKSRSSPRISFLGIYN